MTLRTSIAWLAAIGGLTYLMLALMTLAQGVV
jgi:hypothetical protein